MNYRHGFHAGNFADLLKHTALCELLRLLRHGDASLGHHNGMGATAADQLGYPVVVKLCGDAIAHKSERGLVRLGLGDRAAVDDALDANMVDAFIYQFCNVAKQSNIAQ